MLKTNILNSYDTSNENKIKTIYEKEIKHLEKKIIVLDDDPTGIQTVNGVFVYTDWSYQTIKNAFESNENMFFILTNSRSFTKEQTEKVHLEIAKNISKVYKETKIDFIIVSRSDSTLRGHYPLETETLKNTLENELNKKYDGEIIVPFFKEGGRFTINDIHYVKYGDDLIPAADTEFAKDKSFGYSSSDLKEWCLEKASCKNIISIPIEDFRNFNIEKIKSKLLQAKDFQKIIINAIDYIDLEAFTIAFLDVLKSKREYIFRAAASIVKVLGNINDKKLLNKSDIISSDNKNGGIVIIGSHVNKTTMQLEELKKSNLDIVFIEFNQHKVLEENGLEDEVNRVVHLTEYNIKSGNTVIIYTKRERIDFPKGDADNQIKMSVKISESITKIVSKLNIKPSFIIAKGGITSSDIGTKGLRAKKSLVLGQIENAVPVWLTGNEAKFKNMPYIIFPGNVGDNDTLKNIVEKLMH